MKNIKTKGFTLVEVIVVMVITVILASIMIPSLTRYIDKANCKECELHKSYFKKAVLSEYAEAYGKRKNVRAVAVLDNYLDSHINELLDEEAKHDGVFRYSGVCPDGGVYEIVNIVYNGSTIRFDVVCSDHDDESIDGSQKRLDSFDDDMTYNIGRLRIKS